MQLNLLKKWDNRCKTEGTKHQTLKKTLSELNRMRSALGLANPVGETGSMIARKAVSADIMLGRSVEGVASASLYAAARLENVTHTYEEIGAVSRIDVLEIKRTYTKLQRELNLTIPPASPREYIDRFTDRLNVGSNVSIMAKQIIEDYRDAGVCKGIAPSSVASAAIYAAAIVCDEEVTQSTLSSVCDVSEVTIRDTYPIVFNHFSQITFDDLEGGVENNPSDEIKEYIAHNFEFVEAGQVRRVSHDE
jgi:transcription initiation factor TFIIB